MNKKTSLILGMVSLLTSGLLFTIERLNAYVYWLAKVFTGTYPTEPQMVSLTTNLFVPIFFIIGITFIVVFFKKSTS